MHAFSNSSAVVGHLSTYESTEEENTSQESAAPATIYVKIT